MLAYINFTCKTKFHATWTSDFTTNSTDAFCQVQLEGQEQTSHVDIYPQLSISKTKLI